MLTHFALVSNHWSSSSPQDVKSTKVCSMKLTADAVKKFSYAVDNHYWYQLYLDDLPIWGMIGEADEPQAGAGDAKKVCM